MQLRHLAGGQEASSDPRICWRVTVPTVVGSEIGVRLSLDLDSARAELMSAVDELGFEATDGGSVPPDDGVASVILLMEGVSTSSAPWTARASGLTAAVTAIRRRVAHHRVTTGLQPIPVTVVLAIELSDGRTVAYELLDGDDLDGIGVIDPPAQATADRPVLRWTGHWTAQA